MTVSTAIITSAIIVTNLGIISVHDALPLRMLKDERLTSVDSSLTISPAFCNPRNAMKRPIPAGIAFLTASGIAVKSFVRIPVTVRIINTIPSNNTSTSALA